MVSKVCVMHVSLEFPEYTIGLLNQISINKLIPQLSY